MFFKHAAALAAILWVTDVAQIGTVDAFFSPSTIKAKYSNKKSRHRYVPVPQGRNYHALTVQHGNTEDTRNKQSKPKKTVKKKGKLINSNNKRQVDNNLMAAKAINKRLIDSTSAQEVLDIFISEGGAKGIAGGNAFNSVNFSTFMHRLARFATFVEYSKKNSKNDVSVEDKRRIILSDPRTAILIASLSEALVQPDSNKKLKFNSRELANLGWAVAKLKLAPPSNIYPIVRPEEAEKMKIHQNENNIIYSSRNEMNDDILKTATKVRQQVLEVAKERSANNGAVPNKWIPTMSQLSGKLLDNIASQVLVILSNFNSQELANLLYAFSSSSRADLYFFDKLANQLVVNIKSREKNQLLQPKPQEFSNSIWAFASAGIRCSGQEKLLQCVADILDENNGEIVKDFKPQELSNTAWGVATLISKRSSDRTDEENYQEDQSSLRILRWVAKSLIKRAEDFKPQEISNSIWAFATLGFGATTSTSGQFNTNNEYISLPSDQPDLDNKLVSETLLIVARNSKMRLHRFRPQELNNLVWGYCRLGKYTDEMKMLFAGVGQEILIRHRQFSPQDIGTTLWSFATAEYFDEEVFKAAASELTLSKSRTFKPQELSNTVWALATAGAIPKFTQAFDSTTVKNSHRVTREEIISDPITACFAAATTELIRRPHEFKEQEIKDILWSLSKVGMRHPVAFKRIAEHLVGAEEGDKGRGLSLFSPQGIGNLAWSYAKQAQLAEGGSESLISSTGRLAVYEAISLDVGDDLIRRLFSRIAEISINSPYGLNRSKPQDLSNTCWAFATLGLLHRRFFAEVGDQVEVRLAKFDPSSDYHKMLSKFKGQEIANLVWAFATLNCNCRSIMDHVSRYIKFLCSDDRSGNYDERSIARSFKRQEIANIAWSCAVLEQYPKDLMHILYIALFGKPRSNPDEIKGIYGDEGIQRQAVMTMLYVQMALKIEVPELKLQLPPDFPESWRENTYTNQYVKTVDDRSDASLQLTTSRLQSKVSHALNRQGFVHAQEHVISTDDIESDYNIVLSKENQEFLSIDIADVVNMIGFEVDGPGHFITVLDDSSTSETIEGNMKQENGIALKTGSGTWKVAPNSILQFNGPTSLKDRLLRHLGWTIMHIPYWDWRQLKGEEDGEDEYIQKLLQELK